MNRFEPVTRFTTLAVLVAAGCTGANGMDVDTFGNMDVGHGTLLGL